MRGLKPVKRTSTNDGVDSGDDEEEECDACQLANGEAKDEDVDMDEKERVTFGVFDHTAYVVWDDGSVDISHEGEAVSIPSDLMEKIANDYEEYL